MYSFQNLFLRTRLAQKQFWGAHLTSLPMGSRKEKVTIARRLQRHNCCSYERKHQAQGEEKKEDFNDMLTSQRPLYNILITTSRFAMQLQHRCSTTPRPLPQQAHTSCLHLYDVDTKDGECYMLNLPQPRLPTPTVFDGTTPTFPEWACELRAYLNISQFEYINLLDFAYDAEDPLTTEIMYSSRSTSKH